MKSFLSSRQSVLIPLLIILSLGILLPLPPLSANPLHHDEALYAYWGRLIASGQDGMLNTVPVDKPPLFIYTVALFFKTLGVSKTAARIPSLIANVALIAFTYGLGKRLYGRSTGLLAALLLALSPFTILFAAAALTDPLMTAFVMAAVWAAVAKKPVWAGLSLGLAAATKQQGLFFFPLVLGAVLMKEEGGRRKAEGGRQKAEGGKKMFHPSAFILHPSSFILPPSAFLLAFAVMLLIPLIWDFERAYRPGFWLQSSLSYGPVTFGGAQFVDRLMGFVDLLKFAAGSQILNGVFLIGLPILLLLDLFFRAPSRSHAEHGNEKKGEKALSDWLLAGFTLAFILFHALFTFQIWDRYLLGIIPLLALLLARILHLPFAVRKFTNSQIRHSLLALIFALTAILMAKPAQQATRSGYPIGGDHGAYYGAAETAAYLRGHAGANVTLYHRWLGAHWRYYLFDFPYDFRYWKSAEDLAAQASTNAGGTQYIALPPWQSGAEAEWALADAGLSLSPVFRTYRPDG
ncbi:MAG TPA: hypothetical protein ENK24_05505, partial [Anaerolineae bacterium]|nr:hypothetical protein [Anaerolineae bacterium]